MKSKMLIILLFCSTLSVISCTKQSGGNSTLKVKLTDAPASYDEVNVDIREVNIKVDGDSAEWISLPTTAGIYNLLEYQEGVDTLISEAVINGAVIKEIRLVLGTENSIKSGSEIYPLTIPSGSESGLKIKMNKTLNAGINYLTLDFDAALSVTDESGAYKLRPVIRIAQ
ncbi:MAG TPA: DUF4382 domain-containing protein [Flavitalea sp.]|nr:DUF4382 domain-containing protein [Flavitalea sp.]